MLLFFLRRSLVENVKSLSARLSGETTYQEQVEEQLPVHLQHLQQVHLQLTAVDLYCHDADAGDTIWQVSVPHQAHDCRMSPHEST